MDAIELLLTRAVDTIYPNKTSLEALLRSGKKITLYQGFDPSGTSLHIGHAVAMRKLRQFQDLGHKVIFLIGDFTGMIGDPTGKSSERKALTKEQVENNAKDYVRQASRILRFNGENPVVVKYNSQWLSTLTFADVIRLVSHFTVQQMVERDMFSQRISKGIPVHIHEFLYPAMQGYDSVMMDVNLEIGGTDQTFNMLAGRTLMKEIKNKDKFVMTVPLLTDNQGKKIGKTEGNVIGITDPPADFYAKIMALSDDSILPCFNLLTDKAEGEILTIKKSMDEGKNPMEYKKMLAYELTEQFHSEADARVAQQAFEETFQKGQLNIHNAQVLTIAHNDFSPVDLLMLTNVCSSKSDARRLIKDKAVELDGIPLTLDQKTCQIHPSSTLKIGKKTFFRLEPVQ